MNLHLEINWITYWKREILILQVLHLFFLILLIIYLIIIVLTKFTHIPLDIYPHELAVRKTISTKCYLLPTWNRESFSFYI